MKVIATLLTTLVAIEHFGILMLEMFFWDHPVGRRLFNTTPDFSSASAVVAMNQGLYNGFLASGLVWGLLSQRRDIKIFFLVCIMIAGVFGGMTAKTSILFTQGLPALLALTFVLISSRTFAADKA